MAGYSDFDDSMVIGFLQSTGVINPVFDNIGIPEFNHAKSSAYYIENQVQEDTAENSDSYLDTIIPTIDYDTENDRFASRYSFIDAMGRIPAPEFYTEYPVIVSEDSSAVDQYGSIYKVGAIEEQLEQYKNEENFLKGEAPTIKIELFDSESNLQAEIASIDVYMVWTRAKPTQATKSYYINTMVPDQYEVDLSAGTITIDSDSVIPLLDSYSAKAREIDDDRYLDHSSQPKILFKINVEKYRSVSDLRGLTSEQVNKIATAQAIEAAILEYNYQFNLATQTQMGFHEIVYTAVVTAISTALSITFTAGMGSIVNSFVGKEGIKQLSSNMLKKLFTILSESAKSFSIAGVIGAVVKEMGQELVIDPWIESTVSGLVRRAGGDAIMQMVLSSIAESGREAISGPLSSLFSGSQQAQQQSLSERLDSKYVSKGLKPTMQQFLTEISEYKADIASQQEQNAEQMASLRGANKVLSFIFLATGFAGSFLLGPVGPLMFTTLTTYLSTSGDSMKAVFKKVFNPIIDAISESKVADYMRNNKKKVLLALGIGMVSLGWMALQTSLPSLNELGPLGSIGLGFGGLTIGMVGRPPNFDYMSHITYQYIVKVKNIIEENYGETISNDVFASLIGMSATYLFSKIPSKINTNDNPYISYESLVNWGFRIKTNPEISLNAYAKFHDVTIRYMNIAKLESKYPNKYHIRTNSEILLLELRKSFSIGKEDLIGIDELSTALGFAKSVLGKLIRGEFSREVEYMIEQSFSKILYAIAKCEYENLDRDRANGVMMTYALHADYPIVHSSPEFEFITSLQYAYSDYYRSENGGTKFFSYEELSSILDLAHIWASDLIHNERIPRESDTLIQIRYQIKEANAFGDGVYKDLALKALTDYLSLGRWNIRNQERIANWLESRYGDEYSDYYLNPYPITTLGLLRMLEKVLDNYPSDFSKLRPETYINKMIKQMGMDAYDGASICPRDLPYSQVSLHHPLFWKGTSDKDLLVLVSNANNQRIIHPSRSSQGKLTIAAVKDMMNLMRANDAFKDFKPPEHWSQEAKNEYNERAKLYKVLGFQMFFSIRGYIT